MTTSLAVLVLLAVVSAPAARAAGARAQQGEDQKIGPEAARQIAEIAAAKRARTPAQRKLDTQLLYALKQKRGETRGIPSGPIELDLDERGRALVDITAVVTPGLVSRVAKLGAEVLSTSEKYHTIRARLALERLEAVAGLKDVRYISPAAKAMTNAPGALKQ
ncbi:MAG: hypothetical protein JOZ02_03740 [Acidobacteria bacterium]|nr:hypothetical protein [Acidobacteriota bacterium]